VLVEVVLEGCGWSRGCALTGGQLAEAFDEIACLVQGRTSASVIIAAAPAAQWAHARPQLLRAVAAYLVR